MSASTALSLDSNTLQQWVGKTEQSSVVLDERSVAQMQSIVSLEVAPKLGDQLPHLWHWLFTLPSASLDALNYDGHPKLGGFLPPVALPKRMWAGGRLRFLCPLHVGEIMHRESLIADVKLKQGRSGHLCFITVMHRFFDAEQALCIEEEHDIVYRDELASGSTQYGATKPKYTAQWYQVIEPSTVMLFRYSAAAFNSHRIHYDRDFALKEGYPGLVFHGPLTATLLLQLLQREQPKRVASFNFKAVSPLFDTQSFSLNGCLNNSGDGAHLWATTSEGCLAMTASAKFVDEND